MISFLEGTIEHIGEKSAVICAGGIGYRVIVSPKVLTILAKNKASVNPVRSLARAQSASPADLGEATSNGIKLPVVRLYIHSQLNMREGTFDMYGFTTREDL